MVIVFIYTKGKEIKVLTIKDARLYGYQLEKEGWVITSCINVIQWLSYLYNECKDITKEVKSLSKKIK